MNGYTACIGDGASFEQFVWTAARAFSIWCRDNDGPLPERFEASGRYLEMLRDDERELRLVQDMPPEECARRAAEDAVRMAKFGKQFDAGKSALLAKYNAMLARVRDWVLPTPDHANLKQFMVEQIEEAIKHDCRESAEREEKALTGEEWRAERVADLRESAARYRREHDEEVAATARSNAWLAALRKSVPQPKKVGP